MAEATAAYIKPLLFDRAGKIALFKEVDGVVSRLATNSCTRNGTVESITLNLSPQSKEIPNGNSDFNEERRQKVDGTAKVKMSEFVPEIYSFLMAGKKLETRASQVMHYVDKPFIIPSETPYELEFATKLSNIILTFKDGKPLTENETPAATGDYHYDDTTMKITFTEADKGKEVFLTADYTETDVTGFGLEQVTSNEKYYVIITGESSDGTDRYYNNIVIDRAMQTGDLSQPPQNKEMEGWEFTLKITQPTGQNKPVDWNFKKIVA